MTWRGGNSAASNDVAFFASVSKDKSYFDALPAELRLFLRNSPLEFSSEQIHRAWKGGKSVQDILNHMNDRLTKAVKEDVIRKYDASHPTMAKEEIKYDPDTLPRHCREPRRRAAYRSADLPRDAAKPVRHRRRGKGGA